MFIVAEVCTVPQMRRWHDTAVGSTGCGVGNGRQFTVGTVGTVQVVREIGVEAMETVIEPQ